MYSENTRAYTLGRRWWCQWYGGMSWAVERRCGFIDTCLFWVSCQRSARDAIPRSTRQPGSALQPHALLRRRLDAHVDTP